MLPTCSPRLRRLWTRSSSTVPKIGREPTPWCRSSGRWKSSPIGAGFPRELPNAILTLPALSVLAMRPFPREPMKGRSHGPYHARGGHLVAGRGCCIRSESAASAGAGLARAWTGAPKLTLGYRLPESLGEFSLAYRFLGSEGRALLPGFDFDGSAAPLLSRLDTHVVDLDYATRDFVLGSTHWDVKGTVGARLA